MVEHWLTPRWPERTIDRLRAALRAALQQLARLVEIPGPQTSIAAAKSEAHALIGATSTSFDQTRRYIELTQFEFEESPNGERTSLGNLESTFSRTENVFAAASSLVGDEALATWQRLPADLQMRESALRNAAANRIERTEGLVSPKGSGDDFESALNRWNEVIARLPETQNRVRTALVSQIVAEAQKLK